MNPRPDILSTTRLVLRGLTGLNILLGAGIAVLLSTSFAAAPWLQKALGAQPEQMTGMRLVMLVGLAGIPLAHRMLTRLSTMVETVRDGDPFIPENAARLQDIAWALLWIEVLKLAVGAVSAATPFAIDPGFSLDGWLAVLLLFVLARVFALGTTLRADLEGTV
ncbi:DUF2975 domain-containing protein [Nitrospirillum viridazoti]|uniref:DUF2975 domain-containing protein n=1 Tax=Nitrospirillum viridazoti CBAmc TaxID=1441467 RepID=A0A248JXX9_9PROT|nr:DUF2975 domain-containing protein [Nitrospirillum amazonense]ASG23054.1 hypothetical protein Y958_19530 [Nitrospirillum amazonense CBAmc]TWB38782.1 DUF2975 family protein [Nitrospirillum amazonense]